MQSKFFRRSLSALALVVLCAPALAAEYISHTVSGPKLVVTTSDGTLTMTLHNAQSLAVDYAPKNVKQLPSFAIAGAPAITAAKLKNNRATLEFGSDSLTAIIHKNPVRIDYLFRDKPLLAEEVGLFVEDSLRGFRFKLGADEKILGGGQRVMGMDRRGQRMPLYNKAHYGYETESKQMYFGLPAIMSNKKYIIVFDNSASGYLDIGATETDILQFEAVGGRTSYLVVAGETYPQLINHYVQLTGKQPLPPRWALGNFASRFGYHDEQEVRDTISQFRAKDFPVDALVLDLYWFGKDIKGHMGNLDWDKKAFPNPTKMIADLKADGVNTIVITEPFILTKSKRWQQAVDADVLAKNAAGDAKTFNFYFGNTGLIDVFHKPAQTWFWSIYQDLMLQGVAGWWGDLGEPEVHPDDSLHTVGNQRAAGSEIHNAYGHQWAKMIYENQRRQFPDSRPLIMMRSGFAGSQRYGFLPWTGDVARSWGGLKPQVELALQMSLFGLAYTHSDLGGFAGGESFDQELYVRWLQYGVFQPVYRPHGQEEIAPEPVFHDQKTQDLLRPFIKLRYQLLPYNYTLAYENSSTGMPLMRPLFFEDETNPKLIDNSLSYLWGDAFLVTPITEAGIDSVAVNLPKGVWFDYFSGKRYRGDQTVSVTTHLATLPVLVRAGAFVPMIDPIKTTRDYSSKNLSVHFYADQSIQNAAGKMYEDDGKDPLALQKNAFEILSFNANRGRNQWRFEFKQSGNYVGKPSQRNISLVLHNQTRLPQSVEVNGETLAREAYSFDETAGTVTARFNWNHHPLTLIIKQRPKS